MNEQVLEQVRREFAVMSRWPLPRNAQSVSEARARAGGNPAEPLVVSFVGETCLAGAHVFVDSGKNYDWRFAAGLPVCIVVCPGIDARKAMAHLFLVARSYPTLIDFDLKVAASIIEPGDDKFPRMWIHRRDSDPWRALFD